MKTGNQAMTQLKRAAVLLVATAAVWGLAAPAIPADGHGASVVATVNIAKVAHHQERRAKAGGSST